MTCTFVKRNPKASEEAPHISTAGYKFLYILATCFWEENWESFLSTKLYVLCMLITSSENGVGLGFCVMMMVVRCGGILAKVMSYHLYSQPAM